jgi:hypothetical protein
MFRRYMNIVGEAEGVYFLDGSDWPPEEWAAIREVWDEVDADYRKANMA